MDCRPLVVTVGQGTGVIFREETKRQFYVTEGLAHCFLGVGDGAECCDKGTDVDGPAAEGGIPYDDPTVAIQWPDCGCEYLLSEKDKKHTPFAAQTFEYFERW